MPLIGFLHGGSQREWAHLIEAFRQGLSQAGFVEGRNIANIEFRWAEGQFDRLPGMATRGMCFVNEYVEKRSRSGTPCGRYP